MTGEIKLQSTPTAKNSLEKRGEENYEEFKPPTIETW